MGLGRDEGKTRNGKVLNTTSGCWKVSPRFPHSLPRKEASAEAPIDDFCPSPQIYRPRNEGTRARPWVWGFGCNSLQRLRCVDCTKSGLGSERCFPSEACLIKAIVIAYGQAWKIPHRLTRSWTLQQIIHLLSELNTSCEVCLRLTRHLPYLLLILNQSCELHLYYLSSLLNLLSMLNTLYEFHLSHLSPCPL